MKRILLTAVLAVAMAGMLGHTAYAQTPATLTDIGPNPPTPGPDDAYMEDYFADYPANGTPLNYYSNGGGGGFFPGQIFTTGSNPSGYVLNTLALTCWAGAGGGLLTTPQDYYLRIYQYDSANSNVVLKASYLASNFTPTEEDWQQWTNLGVGLLPNTEYAYTFQNGGDGWIQLGAEQVTTPVPSGFASSLYNAQGNLIDPNNMAALLPSGGGQVFANDMAPGYQADFDVGLVPATFVVNPPLLATPGNVYPVPENVVSNGTVVTFDSGSVLGAGPLFYQWQTDGGAGGPLTNIPGATSSNLVLTVTSNGFYTFDVIVSNNASQSATSTPVSLTVAFATQAASLADEGSTNSSSSYYPSISQLQTGGTGDNLNYYDNDLTAPPGQIFTTGSNPQGYILNSVQIDTGGGTDNGITTPQTYFLYIYSVNAAQTKALIMQAYTNGGFSFPNLGDWLEWSGLNVTLQPNSTYAYTFANNNIGWCSLNSSASSNYDGGIACLISPQTGAIFPDAQGNDGVFYLGFSPIGQTVAQPLANPITVSPAGVILAGNQFTLNESALGAAPLSYQWQTDGGSGAALTNTASSGGSNLVVNTTGWQPGKYSFDVIVGNSSGSVTSAPVTVNVVFADGTATLADLGTNSPLPGANDISQLVNSGAASSPPGLNYYFDNSSPPGETFTTGANPQGYKLTSVAVELAGNSGNLPAGGQVFMLNIYSVNTNTENAVLYATYLSQPGFVITTGVNDTDWLQWSGFSLPLSANSTYAYTFGRLSTGAGYGNDANVAGGLYAGGEAVEIPPVGGAIIESSAPGYNATFDLGLSLGSVSITLSAQKISGGQLELQWPAGILLQAPSLMGPWTTNTATSPYLVSPTGPQMFYEIKAQ